MEADGLPMEESGNTEQLQELARQRFLEFLETFVVNDDEDSRSQFTQGSQQSAPAPPTKLYVEQVHSIRLLHIKQNRFQRAFQCFIAAPMSL